MAKMAGGLLSANTAFPHSLGVGVSGNCGRNIFDCLVPKDTGRGVFLMLP